MITETNFFAETFYSPSMISFRQEKSFHDHALSRGPAAGTAATSAPPAAGATGYRPAWPNPNEVTASIQPGKRTRAGKQSWIAPGAVALG
jgi:hypothetical protein